MLKVESIDTTLHQGIHIVDFYMSMHSPSHQYDESTIRTLPSTGFIDCIEKRYKAIYPSIRSKAMNHPDSTYMWHTCPTIPKGYPIKADVNNNEFDIPIHCREPPDNKVGTKWNKMV